MSQNTANLIKSLPIKGRQNYFREYKKNFLIGDTTGPKCPAADANARASGLVSGLAPYLCLRSDGNVSLGSERSYMAGSIGDDHERIRNTLRGR